MLMRIASEEKHDTFMATTLDSGLCLVDPYSDLNQIDDHVNNMKCLRRQRSGSCDGIMCERRKGISEIITDFKMMKMTRRRKQMRSISGNNQWLIPVDHPVRLLWDLSTIVVSLIGLYLSHTNIRDKSFGPTTLNAFCEIWFLVDIVLNFVTQRRLGRVEYKDWKSICARYLTTWFIIDIISLIPWERYYIRPILEIQKRRNFFVKSFSRTKAVIRVTRFLKGYHFKMFGKVAKRTKYAGVGSRRLLRLLIKYVPKYIFFYRRMKAVMMMKFLRQIHHVHRCMNTLRRTTSTVKEDDDTASTVSFEDDASWFSEDTD